MRDNLAPDQLNRFNRIGSKRRTEAQVPRSQSDELFQALDQVAGSAHYADP
jgi:hypothetical protein